ncbi:MAG: DNA internalization-related competence protein ComEC/Rec2 [Firmicutes bacterium HGW-Firmicutes-13]|nr:MAG: DNA internalization-related competence protein ComEC/Rec2 [Firmicutes bacterium HGW-Firmicutes-13]
MIGAGAFLFKREKDALTAAAASAFIILLIKPLWLFTISFQLSFGSVLSIILFAPFLEKNLEFMPLILKKIISVTLAAQLGVLPLTAYYFFEISLVSLLTNIMVLPIMAVIVGLGFLGSLAGLIFNYSGIFLFNINSIFLTYLINLAEVLSNLPGAYLKVNPPSTYSLFAYYCFIFLVLPHEDLLRWKELKCKLNADSFKKKNSGSIIMVMFLAALVVWAPAFKSRPFLSAVFLDVGQGDSTFIRTSSNRNILIDAGGRPAYLLEEEYDSDFIGERVVVPFLRHQCIKKLDLVILSHPHEDHYSGLIPVIENFPVDLIVTSRAVSDFSLYQRLMELIWEKGIPLLQLQAGDKITLDSELTLEFYNPPERLFTGTIFDLNNNSLVFRLKAGEASFLFSGDAEYPAERHMLSSNFEMGSQVLKAGHHGAYSSTGEQLLEAVSPDIAVVQVGVNSFGHPSPGTLERLEKRGIYVYRTDRDGAVTVTTDGKNFWVKTFLPHLD